MAKPISFDEAGSDSGRPASVADVTARMSKVIAAGGMRKPDEIRPGPGPYEVSFIWAEEKAIVIVDRRKDVEAQLT